MPRLYGTGLYGKGNYSAATTDTLTASHGTVAITGEAAALNWAATLSGLTASYALAGQDVALAWGAAIPAEAGLIQISLQNITFPLSNIWTAQAANAASWTPEIPASDPWTPVVPGTTPWTPN